MRQEIIDFAQAMFPDLDTIKALELLLLMVYATLDDVLFAQEEAEQYPDSASSEAEQYEDAEQEDEVWDYVY